MISPCLIRCIRKAINYRMITMRNILYFALLILLLSFKTDKSLQLINGIYVDTSYNLSYPNTKITGNNFKMYNFGHAGRGMYGWGTYKINPKDSLIVFTYEEMHGNYFYPAKKIKETDPVTLKEQSWIVKGLSVDTSALANKKFDSLFIHCKNYIDKSFERNKELGRIKKVKMKDF
ncbi:MAG: hypothetical protein JWM14_3369 [Chitinophagaceae bacterium]|nr:hypothetical protein [Chitinophagaceae bacterium]